MFERILKEEARARFCRRGNRYFRAAYAVSFLVLISSLWCYSADMVLIRSAGAASSEQRELELATQFYGVNLKIVTVRSGDNALKLLDPLQLDQTMAVAIEADALATVNKKAILHSLHQKRGGDVPLLILGVGPGRIPGSLAPGLAVRLSGRNV